MHRLPIGGSLVSLFFALGLPACMDESGGDAGDSALPGDDENELPDDTPDDGAGDDIREDGDGGSGVDGGIPSEPDAQPTAFGPIRARDRCRPARLAPV